LVTQFTDMVNLEVQQTESFLRSRVMTKPVKGKRFDWQNLSATDDNEQTARHQLVSFGDPTHERRGAVIKTYHQVWGVDRQDDLQSLIELGSPYVKSLAQTMARRFDRVAATAALGSVLTGEEFSTTTSASSDGVVTVDATSTGLTYDKLREIVNAFYAKGVGLTADEKLYLAISNQEHNTLLNEIELLSSDYRRNEFSVESGKVTNALGMGIIVFPASPKNSAAILDVTSSVRSNFAFSTSGICVGINSDIEVRIEDRPDLIDTKQVKALFRIGGLRTEASKVIKVTSTAV
jgi:hypothetical protein